MTNHRLGRNILVPWENKDIIGQVLFGIQSILFFIGAYIQQKEISKASEN